MTRPEALFRHIFGEDAGFLVTFTAEQARFRRSDARHNELDHTRQQSWRYPEQARATSNYLVREAQLARDTYIGVHLFREPGNRRAANATATVRTLWLDEDGGHFPEDGPEPTAIILSSRKRRHLYWRLSQPVAIEWAVAMNRRLAAWSGGDTGKAGAASLLRSPGTANYKRHPQVDLVGGALTGAGPWEPEVLEQAVPLLSDPPRTHHKRRGYDGPAIALEDYLDNVEVINELTDDSGTKYAIVCPWISEHSGGDRTGTRVGQRANGPLWFHCDHEHCQDRTWREFKQKVRRPVRRVRVTRPGYTGPPLEVTIYG
jgi:hypothetical protein